jgi:cell division protein DivIC
LKATTNKLELQGMPASWLVRQGDKQSEEQAKLKREKIKTQNRRRRIVLTVVMLYALAVVFSFGHQFFQMQKIQLDMDSVQSQIKQMQQKNQELKEEVGRLNTDSYVERIAREKLGLVKPGETVLLQAQVNPKMALRNSSAKEDVDLNE